MVLEEIKEMEWYKRSTQRFRFIVLGLMGFDIPPIGSRFYLEKGNKYIYRRISFEEYCNDCWHRNAPFHETGIYMICEDEERHCWIRKIRMNAIILLEDI